MGIVYSYFFPESDSAVGETSLASVSTDPVFMEEAVTIEDKKGVEEIIPNHGVIQIEEGFEVIADRVSGEEDSIVILEDVAQDPVIPVNTLVTHTEEQTSTTTTTTVEEVKEKDKKDQISIAVLKSGVEDLLCELGEEEEEVEELKETDKKVTVTTVTSMKKEQFFSSEMETKVENIGKIVEIKEGLESSSDKVESDLDVPGWVSETSDR